MSFTFDLISDLYATATTAPNFKYQQTSPHVLVAGNIASDRNVLLSVLTNLSKNYSQVFFIDGALEHEGRWDALAESYAELEDIASMFRNVVFLQDRVVIAEGVAILGTNGWWNYHFAPEVDPVRALQWHADLYGVELEQLGAIVHQGIQDAVYLQNSIDRLQKHGDVKKIVLLTNAVPSPELCSVAPTTAAAVLGNTLLLNALKHDTEQKIVGWCYGKSSATADRIASSDVPFFSHPKQTHSGVSFSPLYFPRHIRV